MLGTHGSPQPTSLWLKGDVRSPSECPPRNQGPLPGIWWPNLAQVLPARIIKGQKNIQNHYQVQECILEYAMLARVVFCFSIPNSDAILRLESGPTNT